MGWTYCEHWRTPEEAIAETLDPGAWGESAPAEIHWVRTSKTTAEVYAIMADKQHPEDRSRRWILVGILERAEPAEIYQSACWGIKIMDEAVGPVYTNVPLYYLSKVDPPPVGYGAAWRERVRADQRSGKQRRCERFPIPGREVPSLYE